MHFLLTTFGVLTLGVLGDEASCSLFILTGVSQSNVFGVLVFSAVVYLLLLHCQSNLIAMKLDKRLPW